MKSTIIIPCYNEEKRLPQAQFLDFCKTTENISFLFVNDGSKDNTLGVLEELSKQNKKIKFLDLVQNGGKAEAVRQGMLFAAENMDCDLVGFWDADLATPLFEINHFVNCINKYDFDAVTGLRLLRMGAKVKRKNSRHFFGRIFATVAANILKLPVYDTQCGAKLYRKVIVKQLFTEKFITKWLFDVEILARYITIFGREKAIEKIYEFPLFQWEDVGGSQLKTKDFFNAPKELWKIKKKYF